MTHLRVTIGLVATALAASACGVRVPRDATASSRSPSPSPVRIEANPDARFFWEEPGVEHESLVPLDEIISGGPPPDGIPPIDAPAFVPAGEANWLAVDEPVLALEVEDDVRAYPLQILLWHEIVNDTVGGRPVAVTYCPLCNSAIVYDRRVEGGVTTFGTSGRVYQSDLVMYDRATKSLWPQIMGRAVVGPRIGLELDPVPSQIVSFGEFRDAFPDGLVLSRDTGYDRDYGRTPYAGYDSTRKPFLFRGRVDDRLPAIARIVGVRAGDAAKGYALDAIAERGPVAVVNDRVGDTELVVLFKSGTTSALDAEEVADSRDVGATGVFDRRSGSQTLTMAVRDGAFVDEQTGSTWDLFGRAIDGPLRGSRLDPVDAFDTFWFAWAVFVPDAELWRG